MQSGKPIRRQNQDEGWGWMVVVGSFIIQIIMAGFFHAIGILYVEMKDIFSVRTTEVSWIGSLQTGFLYLAAPIITTTTDSFSPRSVAMLGSFTVVLGLMVSAWMNSVFVLYLTLGVIPGIGFSMENLASVLVINEYFHKKRPIALGIATGSTGLGISLFGPLTRILMDVYSLRGALILISGVTLNCAVGAALFFPIKDKSTDKSRTFLKSLRMICDVRLLLDVEFVMFLMSNVLSSISYWVPLAFLPDFSVANGHSLTDVSNFMIVFGVSSSLGRVVFAIFSHINPRAGPSLYFFGIVLAGVSTLFLPYCTTLEKLFMFVILFGVATGGLAVLTLVLTANLFNPERMSRSLGLVVFSQGVGSVMGGPLSTNLSSLMSNEDFKYYFSGGVYILSGLFLLPLILQNLFCKKIYEVQDELNTRKRDTRKYSEISLVSLSSQKL